MNYNTIQYNTTNVVVQEIMMSSPQCKPKCKQFHKLEVHTLASGLGHHFIKIISFCIQNTISNEMILYNHLYYINAPCCMY